jgi:hypothetical protein
MRTKNKLRPITIAVWQSLRGSMRGRGKELGDIVGPVWNGGPWDAELGIAYRGENGEPVYYIGTRGETTDDFK